MKRPIAPLLIIFLVGSTWSGPPRADADVLGASQTLLVTATAFNSLEAQTDDQPDIAAWGDMLSPGMRVIAVSRDLIPLGLERGAPVQIDGLEGEYQVLDKMHSRWEKRIDIYMGEDVDAALQWGARLVRIRW